MPVDVATCSPRNLILGGIAEHVAGAQNGKDRQPRAGQTKTPGPAKWRVRGRMPKRSRRCPTASGREGQSKLVTGRSSGFRVILPPHLPIPASSQNSGSRDGRHRLQRRVRGRFTRPSLLSQSLGHLQRTYKIRDPGIPSTRISGMVQNSLVPLAEPLGGGLLPWAGRAVASVKGPKMASQGRVSGRHGP